ncbi:helix-turn-helix transcriptional regulator [Bacillus infantis]|uniref:helix-turn-helix domain-containing protein n=1 Tax=Bacillus infantis TaxID=324767 RepID=UPI00344ECD85
MSEFGEYIKKIRESKSLTLNQVALYSEISAAQLSRIETGKRGVPKPPTIQKIADALKVDYEDLMKVAGYINDHKPSKNDEVSDAFYQFEKLTKKEKEFLEKQLEIFREMNEDD